MTRKALLPLLGFAVAFATASFAAEINYKNGAWTWEDGSWEGGVKPGPADTAVIPELPIFKSRILDNRLQSISLTADEEIDLLRFENLYGCVVQGGYKLTLAGIKADSVYPGPDDVISVASNKVAMTSGVVVKGTSAAFEVGENQRLEVATGVQPVEESLILAKTGSGTLVLSSSGEVKAGEIHIEEGVVERTGASYPAFKTPRLVVGGAGKAAVLEFGPSTHVSKVPASADFDVLSGGTVKINAPGSVYQEYLVIDHGTVDAPGYVFIMSNSKDTERAINFVFNGGTLIGEIQWPWAAPFTIVPADRPSVIVGKMNILGNKFDVPDGSAEVDFVIDGKIGGGNRQYGKMGDGTMLFIDRDPSDLYGIGKDFTVEAGRFYLQSETAVGLGTNNIVVSAGATFGGTGSQVGGIDPVNAIRGLRGNITLNGADGNPAVFEPGTIDYEAGAFVPGTFTLGSDSQTNNLTFATSCTLKIGATAEGVSALVVNGMFTLSGNDTLSIVGPEDVHKIPAGDYAIVTTTEAMNRPFATVLYNGSPVAGSGLKVRQEANRIVLRVPRTGMTVIVR